VVTVPHCPDEGEIVWITLDPTLGHEQRGRRTVLVLSPKSYNARAKLCVVCPITNTQRGYPFEVALPAGAVATGVVLADQARSVSWNERNAQLIGLAPTSVITSVRGKLKALLRIS
jgi:mRNA interferase MazF